LSVITRTDNEEKGNQFYFETRKLVRYVKHSSNYYFSYTENCMYMNAKQIA